MLKTRRDLSCGDQEQRTGRVLVVSVAAAIGLAIFAARGVA
jgi:hypothetical protein